MTQPLSSYGPDRTQDLTYDPDDGPPTSPATRVAVPKPPPMPELPDTDHAALLNMVQAAKSPPPSHMMLAMGVRGEDVEYIVAPTPMQKRLDAFKESATLSFQTETEGDAEVAIPFRMVRSDAFMRRQDERAQPLIRQERIAMSNRGEMSAVARKAGLTELEISAVGSGRGTPEQIQRVTQALIDTGKLQAPPPSDLGGRIRTMMCNYGVGLDCAGYVQQAFLASRGITQSQSGLKETTKEDLTNLAGKGFKKVPEPQVRAGDMFILKGYAGATGHTMIVRDSRLLTPEEAEGLARVAPATWAHPNPATVRRIELDSSWGNNADPVAGGVLRQVFWHDETTDRWLRQTCTDPPLFAVETRKNLYFDHQVDGVYRPQQEP